MHDVHTSLNKKHVLWCILFIVIINLPILLLLKPSLYIEGRSDHLVVHRVQRLARHDVADSLVLLLLHQLLGLRGLLSHCGRVSTSLCARDLQ